MPDFMLFQLYGPMVSWGDIAVGERRGSRDHAGRSAILGLVAAALGIERTAEVQLANLAAAIGVAVRLDAPGIPLRDFHTAQVPEHRRGARYPTRRAELSRHEADTIWEKRPNRPPSKSINTIVSQRDYYLDALSTVALWTRDRTHWPLEAIRDRLAAPEFTLYLGRRACPPALPLDPRIEPDMPGLLEALARRPWPKVLDRDRLRHGDAARLYYERDVPGRPPQPESETARRDEPTSRRRWQFALRAELQATVPLPREEAAHGSALL